MTVETLHSAIRTRVQLLVEQAQSLPVVYDNGPALGASGSPYAVPDPDSTVWARAAIVPSMTEPVSMDGPSGGAAVSTFRTVGLLLVSLYGPLEQGDGPLLPYVDAVADAFSAASTTDFAFQTPEARAGRRDGDWWRIDVACPFRADEIA